jgi:hypothetical protein
MINLPEGTKVKIISTSCATYGEHGKCIGAEGYISTELPSAHSLEVHFASGKCPCNNGTHSTWCSGLRDRDLQLLNTKELI